MNPSRYRRRGNESQIRRAITLDGKELVDRAGTSQVRILGRNVPNSDAGRGRILEDTDGFDIIGVDKKVIAGRVAVDDI